MEYYTLRTKDGLLLTGIPGDIPKDSPILKERIMRLRAASGLPSPGVSQAPNSAAMEAMQRQGYVAAESFLPPEAMAPPQQPAGEAPDTSVEEAQRAIQAQANAPETTIGGMLGSAVMGAAPALLGGALGGAAGLLAGGAGAIPGALIGAQVGAGSDLLVTLAKAVTGADFTTPGEAARALFRKLGVPDPDTQAEKLMESFGAGAGGGLGSATAAKVAAAALPTGSRAARIAATMAEGPGMQTAMGAAGGAGGEAARQFVESKGYGPEAQLAATLLGDVATSGLGSAALRRVPGIPGGMTTVPAALSPKRAEQIADIAAAERAGITPMTSDVFKPKTSSGQALQQTTEAIPFVGTGEARKAQQAQRANVAEKFLVELGAVPEADPVALKVAEDLISTRKARVNDLVKKKSDVLNEVEAAGPVDVSRVENEIVKQVSELSKLPGGEFKVATAFLEEMFDKLRGQPISVIEEQRKVLGNRLEGPEFSRVKTQVGKAFNAIYESFNKDMADHIQNNAANPADAVSKWRNANRELAVLMGQFRKSKKLQDAVNAGGERISDIASILKDQDPTVISKLNSNLSPQGQANLRALIVSKVAMDAGGLGDIQPNKFLTSVQKYAKQFGVTLPKEKMNELRDLQRALKLTARADVAVKGPTTGYRVLPLVAATLSGASAGPVATAIGGLSLGKLANAMESPAVRNLLIKMPEMKPGSPQELELAQRIVMAIGDVTGEQVKQQQQPSMQ